MVLKLKKFILIISVLIVILLTLSGCSLEVLKVENDIDGFVRHNEEGNSTDPALGTGVLNWVVKEGSVEPFSIYKELSFEEKSILNNCFSGIFETVDSGVKTDLARNVFISENGREVLITLSDENWSNGEPITSYDVINSWREYESHCGEKYLESIGIEDLSIIDSKSFRVYLNRKNDNILNYLSDLRLKVYPSSVLKGGMVFGESYENIYSGKYKIGKDEDENPILLINEKRNKDSKPFIKEVRIVTKGYFDMNFDERIEFYIDGSHDMNDYDQYLKFSKEFSYLPTEVVKTIIINPRSNVLNDKYDRITLANSLDIDGISDYCTEGLGTTTSTLGIFNNWDFNYGYIESFIIENREFVCNRTELSLLYIDNEENRRIYDILNFILSNNYGIVITGYPATPEEYEYAVTTDEYDMFIKDISNFGNLSDRYMYGISDYFTGEELNLTGDKFSDMIRNYQHTEEDSYLKRAELDFKLSGYVVPLFNCGYPALMDERLDLSEFYNSMFMDFSKVQYK